MKTLIVIAVLIGGLLLMWAASAHSAGNCQTEAEVRALAMQQSPQVRMRSMTADETQAFIRAWNAFPPPSELKADTALIVDNPFLPKLAVVLFINGCTAKVPLPTREMFINLMREWTAKPQEKAS
jgi:hypothetical protein